MRKGMKRALALTLAAILAGGTAVIPASAQEAGEYYPETGSYAQEEENVATVTGMKDTLRCESAEKNMNWGFFSENGGSVDWYGRMGFPEYAMNLYSMLGDGSVTVDDGNFSEDTAFTTNYSDGSSDVFNGFNVCELYDSPKMSDQEWSEMKENLASAYVAFKRDYPGVFWLNDSPEVIRVENSETLEGGEEIYSYQIYFVLKDHKNDFDIRDSKYQSAEAINEKIEQRNQSIQEVFDEMLNEGLAGKITYFRENANTVAGSMGLGKDGYARAVKLLCDEAGITSVIADGECYVLLDSGWCAASDVKEEADAAEPGTTDEQDGTDAGDDNKADEKSEESKKEEKEDSTGSKWKIGGAAAAAPAFKSMILKSASKSTRSLETMNDIKFLKTNEDGSKTEVTSSEELFGILFEEVIENCVYGKRLDEMVKLKGVDGFAQNYGITATVTYDDGKGGTKEEEINNLQFVYTSNLQEGGSFRPAAQAGYSYSIDCVGRTDSEPDFSRQGIITRRTPEIKTRYLEVYTNRLEYNWVYGTDQFVEILNGDQSSKLSYSETPIGDVKVTPSIISGTRTPTKLQNGTDDEFSGTVDIMLTLSGSGARNYTLDQNKNTVSNTGTSIRVNGIHYSSMANEINPDRLKIELSQYKYEYKKGELRMPEVTVKGPKGEILNEGDDYFLYYDNNEYASKEQGKAEAEVYITANNSTGRRYVWKGKASAYFEISKATVLNKTREVITKYGKTEKVDITDLLNEESGSITVRAASDQESQEIFEGGDQAPAFEEGQYVVYKVKKDPNLRTKTGRLIVTVNESSNYGAYVIEMKVTVADKDPQTDFRFEHDVIKMPRGTKKNISVIKTVEGSEVSYESGDSSIATVTVQDNGKVEVEALQEGDVTIKAKATDTDDYLAAEASYKIRVIPEGSVVTMSDPFANGDRRYKLEIEEGISRIPSEISAEYPEISKIEQKLKEELQKLDPTNPILDKDIKIYDVNLMVQRVANNADGTNKVPVVENTWKLVEDETDFPSGGLPITMPYPEGTDSRRYNFKAVHMFTKNLTNTNAGEIETCGITEQDKGVQFTVKGLSPIAIGWYEDDSIRSDQTDFRFELGVVKMAYGDERNIGVLQTVPNSTITYTTSDDSVAMVDNNGRVEAVGEGEAIITATSTKTDDYRAAQASYRIIVVPEDTKIKTLNQFSSGNKKYRLQMEEGISQIPETIENEYPEGEDVINKMRSELKKANDKITDENMAVYDITLLVQQEVGMGVNTWEEVIEETDFPSKLAITLPYPEGTDKDGYDFAAVHMFTTEVNGKTPGEIEQPKITERSDGIRLTVTGLSPVAVGWIQTQADDPTNPDNPTNPDDPGNSGDPSNPDNPTNPSDPTNPTDPSNPTNPTNPSDPNNNNNNQGNGNDNNQGNNNGNGSTGNNNNNGTTGTGTTGTGTTGTGTTGTGTTGTGTTGTGSTTQTGTNATGAKTGDQNQILLYSILLAAAAAVIWIVCASRRKRR